MKRNGVLVVIDGWGYGEDNEFNAFCSAETPVLDRLMQQYPHTLLGASGESVGLPKGAVGNSEIGHLTIGAGRTIDYESTRVERASADGTLAGHPELIDRLADLASRRKALHLIGLCSDGMVHSHLNHFIPFVLVAKQAGVEQVYLHAFADGRDVSDGTAEEHFNRLEMLLRQSESGRIATVVGRAYAMDRNGDWTLTKRVYDALVQGKGTRVGSVQAAIRQAREQKLADEWVEPTVMVNETGEPIGRIRTGDLVITVNFRGDRMVQLVSSLAQPDFSPFSREQHPQMEMMTITDYSLPFQVPVLFPKVSADGGIADRFFEYGIYNTRIAESEKFPHVTYYFNGKAKKERPQEEHFHIPSPANKNYRQIPEMSALQVTEQTVSQILRPEVRFTLVNLCNADVVGHTGDMQAIRRAVESVDRSLGQIVETALSQGSWVAVVGDHGNAEVMWDKYLQMAHVGHTTNPVPFLLVHPDDYGGRLSNQGSLANVAPTLLQLLGVASSGSALGKMEDSLIEPKRYHLASEL